MQIILSKVPLSNSLSTQYCFLKDVEIISSMLFLFLATIFDIARLSCFACVFSTLCCGI